MNINQLIKITNDLETCAFCPDEDCTDICAHCDKAKPITAEEMHEYYREAGEVPGVRVDDRLSEKMKGDQH